MFKTKAIFLNKKTHSNIGQHGDHAQRFGVGKAVPPVNVMVLNKVACLEAALNIDALQG